MLDAADRTRSRPHLIRIPVLFVHGAQDAITDPKVCVQNVVTYRWCITFSPSVGLCSCVGVHFSLFFKKVIAAKRYFILWSRALVVRSVSLMGVDRTVQATIEFSKGVGTDDATLWIIEGGAHELHNDSLMSQTIAGMGKWLQDHVSACEVCGVLAIPTCKLAMRPAWWMGYLLK